MNIIDQVKEAMNRVKECECKMCVENFNSCWWLIPQINSVLVDGVKQGWLLRGSITQIQWSKQGIKSCFDSETFNRCYPEG